ncbi:hypothetical protein H3S71_01995 [Commensalibacter sp. W8133]|uniref:hypothetical protein n=1 Tax=Commensalibacter sp. W8133 TaxID=2750953 RepID=UPI0018DE8D68|nr:hypothetical protein [Commensalibacter sp. W8133]MBI0018103.1 hypothetical protein [Commensalibacter sp. W8133]
MYFISTIKKLFCPENSSSEIDKRYDSHDSYIIHFYELEIQGMKNRICSLKDNIKKMERCEIRIAGLNQERAKHYRDQREEYERQVKELQNSISLREAILDANHSIFGMKGINGHA